MISRIKSGSAGSSAQRTRRQALLDFVLPGCCALCGLYSGAGRLCPPCQADLPRLADACRQCAVPGLRSDVMVCGACLRKAPAWDRALAALVYEFPVDKIVQRFKFQRNLACAQILADELVQCIERSGADAPDILIPVPLHYTRRFWRGFNQAEFLARQLGSRLDIPVLVHKLRRKRRTLAQSGLRRGERQRNIRGAFHCRQTGKVKVALVDDVMTTGTTLAACTRAVRAAGASHVSVWVAARVDSTWSAGL